MKPCPRYAELISRQVDGELNTQEQKNLTAHLSQCNRCAAKRKAYITIRTALNNSYDKDFPSETPPSPSFAYWRIAAMFLAAIGIGFAFFMAGQHVHLTRQPGIALTANTLSPPFAAPLGSITYYEEIAQNAATLHDAATQSRPFEAQFGRENDSTITLCYQSPLFNDGDLLGSHYKTLAGCRVNSE